MNGSPLNRPSFKELANYLEWSSKNTGQDIKQQTLQLFNAITLIFRELEMIEEALQKLSSDIEHINTELDSDTHRKAGCTQDCPGELNGCTPNCPDYKSDKV